MAIVKGILAGIGTFAGLLAFGGFIIASSIISLFSPSNAGNSIIPAVLLALAPSIGIAIFAFRGCCAKEPSYVIIGVFFGAALSSLILVIASFMALSGKLY